jgi:hypothetical protein
METNLLSNANEDRRLSIGASQNRRKDRRTLRLPISMAKVAQIVYGKTNLLRKTRRGYML